MTHAVALEKLKALAGAAFESAAREMTLVGRLDPLRFRTQFAWRHWQQGWSRFARHEGPRYQALVHSCGADWTLWAVSVDGVCVVRGLGEGENGFGNGLRVAERCLHDLGARIKG